MSAAVGAIARPRPRAWRQWPWLVGYELLALWRDRGLRLLIGLTLALALYALQQGAGFARSQQQAAQAASAQESRALAEAAEQAQAHLADPAAPADAGVPWWRAPFDIRGYAFRAHLGFAVKPELPGAAFAVGQADLLPGYLRIRAESMETSLSAYEIEHPARLAAGRFDLGFFLSCLWPLVLLALGVPVLTHDRELGRLSTLQLQGATPGRVLAARLLARCGGAALLLVLAVAA